MVSPTNLHGNSTFSAEMASAICEAIASSSKGLRSLCAERDDLPSWQTIMVWLNHYLDFQEQYARAKQRQMELIGEEILEIADAPASDSAQVQRAKLQVETRKWLMSKLAPKKYGDRIDVTSSGEKLPMPSHHIDARVQSIIMQAMQRRAAATDLPPEAQKLLE